MKRGVILLIFATLLISNALAQEETNPETLEVEVVEESEKEIDVFEDIGEVALKENAGLTGEFKADEVECKRMMEDMGPGGFGGPHMGFGAHCGGIQDPVERLECFDSAMDQDHFESFEERYEETKERERECAKSCSEQNKPWDFSGGYCQCHDVDHDSYEEYYGDYGMYNPGGGPGEYYEHPEDYYQEYYGDYEDEYFPGENGYYPDDYGEYYPGDYENEHYPEDGYYEGEYSPEYEDYPYYEEEYYGGDQPYEGEGYYNEGYEGDHNGGDYEGDDYGDHEGGDYDGQNGGDYDGGDSGGNGGGEGGP